jgi:hypothetical protein
MTAQTIDLARVRESKAKLSHLAVAHPELRGERSAANVREWITTLEGDEMYPRYQKKCEQCGKPFAAERITGRFCSNPCRAMHNRRRTERGISDLAAALMRAAQLVESYDNSRGFPNAGDVKRARDRALREAYDAIAAELRIPTMAEREAMAEQLEEPVIRVRRSKSKPIDAPGLADNAGEANAEQLEEPKRVAFTAEDAEGLRAGVKRRLDQTGQSQRAFAADVGVNSGDFSRFIAGKKNLSEKHRTTIAGLLNETR